MEFISLAISLISIIISITFNLHISYKIQKQNLNSTFSGDHQNIVQNISFAMISRLTLDEKKELLDYMQKNLNFDVNGGDL